MSERHTSLRPVGLPRAISMRVDAEGMPIAVTRVAARGRHGTETHVESIDEIWRVAEAWWREGSQARTYFRVILEGGRPLSVYRDDATGAWFEQPYSEPRQEGTAR
ncbi:MAG: hypothetical protein O2798_02015 [Chloroflexi bacterium]|nr:hypothetical protein [Chloroflexota bacterium]MDA1239597.1 hypothetical protein [Chloroflexota bacterium]